MLLMAIYEPIITFPFETADDTTLFIQIADDF